MDQTRPEFQPNSKRRVNEKSGHFQMKALPQKGLRNEGVYVDTEFLSTTEDIISGVNMLRSRYIGC